MVKLRNIHAELPVVDSSRASDSELVLYLGLQGVKVLSPSLGKFYMAHKSKQVPLKAGLFSDALKEAVYCLGHGIKSEHLATELGAFAGNLRQPSDAAASYRLNSGKEVAVSTSYRLNKDMAACPRGVKVLLLGAGGVLVIGQYAGEPFWEEWCALPKRAD